jgi:hypothetical protein
VTPRGTLHLAALQQRGQHQSGPHVVVQCFNANFASKIALERGGNSHR